MAEYSTIREFAEAAQDGEVATVAISRDDAAWVHSWQRAWPETQRAISASHATALRAAMENGAWADGSTLHIARCDGAESPFLADGQHRMAAHEQVGKTIRYAVSMRAFADKGEVGRYFASLDTAARKRSKSDQRAAFADRLTGYAEVEPVALRAAMWGALEVLEARTSGGFLYTPAAHVAAWNDRHELIAEYVAQIRRQPRNNKPLRGVAVIAPCLHLLAADRERARDFIYEVSAPQDGDNWPAACRDWLNMTPRQLRDSGKLKGPDGQIKVRTATAMVLFAAYNRRLANKPVPTRNPFAVAHLLRRDGDAVFDGWTHDVKQEWFR